MIKTTVNNVVLTCAVALLLIINTAQAIKCWECRSDADPKCADPFDNKTLAITDCDQVTATEQIFARIDNPKATMCRKIRQKVNGVWKYFRSCAFLGDVGVKGDERFCLMRTGSYNIFMEYCTCNSKDGCNSANRQLYISKFVFVVAIVTSCFLIVQFQ